jgi:hypothetical protein
VGPQAWRTGGGASSAMAIRRRQRELGLRRADGLAWPTRGRVSSLGVREGLGVLKQSWMRAEQ